MDAILVTFAIAVAVIAFYLLLAKLLSRRPPGVRSASSAPEEGERVDTRWRAVRVAPGLICCDAVSKLDGQVFLSRLSPKLPLDECDARDCRCKYVHLDDRRNGGDRRAALGELDAYLPFNQGERRKSEGRRTADLVH